MSKKTVLQPGISIIPLQRPSKEEFVVTTEYPVTREYTKQLCQHADKVEAELAADPVYMRELAERHRKQRAVRRPAKAART